MLATMAIMLLIAAAIAMAIAFIAFAMASTAACAHLACHGLRHFLITRGVSLFDGQAEVLMNRRKHQI